MVYDMFGTYCVDITMNDRFKELVEQASSGACYDEPGAVTLYNDEIKKFAELIVKECARLARNANLEDVEGGDSAVLRAAGDQIEDYFGVEE